MKLLAVFLCVLSQVFLVSGQLFFKWAMAPKKPQNGVKTAMLLITGIATQTAWFFVWDNLLVKWDLSRIYPFEGLNPAMMALLAWVMLKERLPPIAWMGLVLICAGIGLATTS